MIEAPRINEEVPGMPEELEEIIKRIYITKKDLDKYGRTEGYPGCRASLRGGRANLTPRSAAQS